MRMGALSTTTGVSVPTLKFYLREGLLHPGERTSPNQAQYDDTHVRRVALIRAMLDHGGMSIADARDVIHGIETRQRVGAVLEAAQLGILGPPQELTAEDRAWAQKLLEPALTKIGWMDCIDLPVAQRVLTIVVAYRDAGGRVDTLAELADDYVQIAAEVGAVDIASLQDSPDVEHLVQAAVVGTVLGGALLGALRMLAHAHVTISADGTGLPPD